MAIDTLITIGIFTAVALLFIFAGVKTVPQGNNWTVEHAAKPMKVSQDVLQNIDIADDIQPFSDVEIG
mgnify:CR=1 FL=1